MTNLGSNPREHFQQRLGPLINSYCLLSNGPLSVYVEVFIRDEKLVSVSDLVVTESTNTVNRGMAK
jgi:hypothetical protein